MLLFRGLVFCILSLSLLGCSQNNDYKKWLQQPALLSETLEHCDQGQQVGDKTCQQARLTKAVMTQFAIDAAPFLRAERRFALLQEQASTDPENAVLRADLVEESVILNTLFVDLQAKLAKQIMDMEADLANIKQKLIQAPKNTALLLREEELKQKLQVVLVLVGMSGGEALENGG